MANSPGILDSQLARHGPILSATPRPVKRKSAKITQVIAARMTEKPQSEGSERVWKMRFLQL